MCLLIAAGRGLIRLRSLRPSVFFVGWCLVPSNRSARAPTQCTDSKFNLQSAVLTCVRDLVLAVDCAQSSAASTFCFSTLLPPRASLFSAGASLRERIRGNAFLSIVRVVNGDAGAPAVGMVRERRHSKCVRVGGVCRRRHFPLDSSSPKPISTLGPTWWPAPSPAAAPCWCCTRLTSSRRACKVRVRRSFVCARSRRVVRAGRPGAQQHATATRPHSAPTQQPARAYLKARPNKPYKSTQN